MRSGWRIGSLFNIPFFVDPSWFLILILATSVNALDFASHWGWTLAWSAGFAMALLLFISVLLHELGHSLVARKQGIAVNSITLFLFGGVAAIDRESKTPEEALQVAIAGPAVSISLFALLRLVAAAIPETYFLHDLVISLSTINLVLALFNLIPGLPLDGGQVLKALVWKVTGNRFQGVRWAARTGQTLGILAIASGITFDFLTEELFSGFWMALLGWFCLRNANRYNRVANLQEALLQLTAADATSREFRVVDAKMSLRQFTEIYLQETTRPPVYFAASDGRYRGRVAAETLSNLERSQWDILTLEAIAQPLSSLITVEEKTPLAEVINCMEVNHLNYITVLTPADAVSGMIDRGEIVRAVAKKLDLPMSESEIEQIKQEGTYPSGLQLDAIAKSTL